MKITNEELYGGADDALACAEESIENHRKLVKDAMKQADKMTKDVVKATASEESRNKIKAPKSADLKSLGLCEAKVVEDVNFDEYGYRRFEVEAVIPVTVRCEVIAIDESEAEELVYDNVYLEEYMNETVGAESNDSDRVEIKEVCDGGSGVEQVEIVDDLGEVSREEAIELGLVDIEDEFEESIKIKSRAELGKAITEAKKTGRPIKVTRCLDEGYRFLLTIGKKDRQAFKEALGKGKHRFKKPQIEDEGLLDAGKEAVKGVVNTAKSVVNGVVNTGKALVKSKKEDLDEGFWSGGMAEEALIREYAKENDIKSPCDIEWKKLLKWLDENTKDSDYSYGNKNGGYDIVHLVLDDLCKRNILFKESCKCEESKQLKESVNWCWVVMDTKEELEKWLRNNYDLEPNSEVNGVKLKSGRVGCYIHIGLINKDSVDNFFRYLDKDTEEHPEDYKCKVEEPLKEDWEDLNSYEDVVNFTKECGGRWSVGLPKEKAGERYYNAYAKNGKHFVGDRKNCILALKDEEGNIVSKYDKDDRPVNEGKVCPKCGKELKPGEKPCKKCKDELKEEESCRVIKNKAQANRETKGTKWGLDRFFQEYKDAGCELSVCGEGEDKVLSIKRQDGSVVKFDVNDRIMNEKLCESSDNDEVIIYCYAEDRRNRKEAIKFFREAARACEGSEAERYWEVLDDLESGLHICWDKVTRLPDSVRDEYDSQEPVEEGLLGAAALGAAAGIGAAHTAHAIGNGIKNILASNEGEKKCCDCEEDCDEGFNSVAGTIAGGTIGGAAGRNIGKAVGGSTGAAIGGAVGSLAGAGIGHHIGAEKDKNSIINKLNTKIPGRGLLASDRGEKEEGLISAGKAAVGGIVDTAKSVVNGVVNTGRALFNSDECEKGECEEKIPLKEDAKIIIDLNDFEPWSGAVHTWELIEEAGKIDELDFALEDMYPDGITSTELNDLLWFESDWILDQLGIEEEDVLSKREPDDELEIEEPEEEEELEFDLEDEEEE